MTYNEQLAGILGIAHPIMQAPMAGCCGVDMAVAVSEAGGLGALPAAALDAASLDAALDALRCRTTRPCNVNFFAHTTTSDASAADAAWLERLAGYYDEMGLALPQALSDGSLEPFDDARCAVVERHAPAVVSFHFGLPPARLVQRLKAVGSRIAATATTVEEARWLVGGGCDLVIAQGAEAGGHRGMFLTDDATTQCGTMALVPQIVDAVDVPVVAAGGIADGRGIAAALALGAAGVQIGTAYLFTTEATIDEGYRQALATARSADTVLTNVFSGRPARCVVNRVVREQGPLARDVVPFPRGFAALAPLRAAAQGAGKDDFAARYCGQAAALCRPTTAGQLTRDLAAATRRRIDALVGATAG